MVKKQKKEKAAKNKVTKEKNKEYFEGRGVLNIGGDSYIYWVRGHKDGIMEAFQCDIKHDSETGILITPKESELVSIGYYKKNPKQGGYGRYINGKFASVSKYRHLDTIHLIPRSLKDDKITLKPYLDPHF